MSLAQAMHQFYGLEAAVNAYAEELDDGAVVLGFASGSYIHATYWRLLQLDGTRLSSFDHGQRYGLPSKIDAVARLREALAGKVVTTSSVDVESADICLEFAGGDRLQIFGFTAYEVWEVRFSDQKVEYSNHR